MSIDPYTRTTTASALRDLPVAVREALDERVEQAAITLGEDTRVFVTRSTRRSKPGFFARRMGGDPDLEHLTVLVVGRRDVLVATSGERRGTHVLTCRLQDAEITAPLAGAEAGMSVRGFPVGGPDGGVGEYFVGLGAPHGDHARHVLREAIRAAKAA